MAKKELVVFLSSDQKEFAKLRNVLAKTICNIPFLSCTPLENRGADPIGVVEASIKAVEKSDIYVGIFGREYSETTIWEYNKAVERRLPCFIYVRIARRRDPQLSKFINDVLKNQFHFFEFHHSADVEFQIDADLRRFILDTIILGLDERAKKKEETKQLFIKEEKAQPENTTNEKLITQATVSFKQGHYLEPLVMASIALENNLRKALLKKKTNLRSNSSLGELIMAAEKFQLLKKDDIESLRRISYLRNIAVHQGDTPDSNTVAWILGISKIIIDKLDLQENGSLKQQENVNSIPSHSIASNLWNPLPKINFTVAQQLLRVLQFPTVGWEAYNDSPYQLRVRIEVHPILGGKDLHPLSDKHINGSSVYPVEPNSPLFGNGCFTLPDICATSEEELILEIRATVEDTNDLSKGKYSLIPRRWKYNRKSNTWSYHPQMLMPE
jgi:hypothetical protein